MAQKFTPDLINNLHWWFTPTLATLWQDSGEATAVTTDAQSVGAWKDSSANGFDIVSGPIITLTATGGTYTISVTAGGSTQTTSALAYNATAATIQAAIVALSNVGTGNVVVTKFATYPVNIYFPVSLGTVTITVGTGSLTGGTATVTNSAPTYKAAGTINGRPTLRFNGSQYLVGNTGRTTKTGMSAIANGSSTMFFVVQPVSTAGGAQILNKSSAIGDARYSLLLYNLQPQFYRSTLSRSAYKTTQNPVITNNTPYILTHRMTWHGDDPVLAVGQTNSQCTEEFWINGAYCGKLATNVPAFDLTTNWMLGGLAPYPQYAYGLNADSGDILAYSRAIEESERQQVESYLSTTYAIQVQAPKKTETQVPRVVLHALGDSITQATNTAAGGGWFAFVQDNLPYSHHAYNFGESGSTLAQAYANTLKREQLFFSPDKLNIAYVFTGGNDLATATGAAQTVIQGYQNYATTLRNAGFKSIIFTIPDRTGAGSFTGGQTPSGFATDRATVNTWIQANWQNWFDGIVDIGSTTAATVNGKTFNTSVLGANNASTSATYFVDAAIHPSDYSHQTIMGPMAVEATKLIVSRYRVAA